MFQRTVQVRDQIQPTQIPRSQTTGGIKSQNQGHLQLLLFRVERLKNWTPKPASNMAEFVAHCYKNRPLRKALQGTFCRKKASKLCTFAGPGEETYHVFRSLQGYRLEVRPSATQDFCIVVVVFFV